MQLNSICIVNEAKTLFTITEKLTMAVVENFFEEKSPLTILMHPV